MLRLMLKMLTVVPATAASGGTHMQGLRGARTHGSWNSVNSTVQSSVTFDPADQTDITMRLNFAIQRGTDGVYTGGKGVLVRNPFDGMDDTPYLVFPATFWVNDLYMPSQLYPPGMPPQCPCEDCYWSSEAVEHPCVSGSDDPWNFAPVAAVIESSLPSFFQDFDNIQDESWGNGVFYATDANAVDGRCYYVEANNAYDCPGYWIPFGEDPQWLPDKVGAGGYPVGNPFAETNTGGGAGCHFANGNTNQQDADDGNRKLVQDPTCQCDYSFKAGVDAYDVTNNGWDQWVQQWIDNFQGAHDDYQMPGANWNVDEAACWVNNPRDLINLQNQIWWARARWSDQQTPKSNWDLNDPWSDRIYWGWNEIPVDRDLVSDVRNWDAVVIQLPAGCNGFEKAYADCLSDAALTQLEQDLDKFVNNGKLVPGADSITERPGSYVALVRQYRMGDGSGNWNREFYCENFVVGKYEIKFAAADDANTGYCYLDYA